MEVIHTLHDFMFRTESITYIIIVIVLIAWPFFWRFLNASDED